MKPTHSRTIRGFAAFTLIELIGVMSIIAIMASIMVPSVLRSIEIAAIRAEGETLHNLGENVKLYVRDKRGAAMTNWTTDLAAYTSLPASQISLNRRGNPRVYVPEPATAAGSQRALLLSSMRPGLLLPSTTIITANFSAIWDTEEGKPQTSPGWTAWTPTASAMSQSDFQYLVIERVNLAPLYRTDLQSLLFSLKNSGTATVSYRVVQADGTARTHVNLLAGGATSGTALSLQPRDRIDLYKDANMVTLDYSYIVSTTGKTLIYSGTTWNPQ